MPRPTGRGTISRQAPYRTRTPRRPPQRRPSSDLVKLAIVEEALANQTDGYRMVTAFVQQRLGSGVNRKRVLLTGPRLSVHSL